MNGLLEILMLMPQAVAGAFIIAAVMGVLGLFLVLRRASFLGITLAEVSICGVALSWLLNLPAMAGATPLTLASILALTRIDEARGIPRDAVLGIIFAAASSFAILFVARSPFGLNEVKTLFAGDIVLVSAGDLAVIFTVLVPAGIIFLASWRPILHTFFDREQAKLLGIRTGFWEFLFFLLLGLSISAASRAAGALLVFTYLVVAPATVLLLGGPIQVMFIRVTVFSCATTIAGITMAILFDLPTNPTVSALECLGFLAALILTSFQRNFMRVR